MTEPAQAAAKRSIPRGLVVIAKLSVTAALLAFIARRLDVEGIATRLASVSPGIVAGAIVVSIMLAFGHALRWLEVLRANGCAFPFGQVVRLVLIGYFFNQTLPSAIGGDAYRIWGALRHGVPGNQAAATVIMDRIVAMTALIVMLAIMSPWLVRLVPGNLGPWLVAAMIVACIASIGVLAMLDRLPTTLRRFAATRLAGLLAVTTRRVLLNPARCASLLVLTIGLHIVAALVVYSLAVGMGIAVRPLDCILLFPLVILVTVAPISIAGWGVREGAMVVALGWIGVPAVSAFSLSVLFGLVMMASGIPGGILWLVGNHHRSMTPDAATDQARP